MIGYPPIKGVIMSHEQMLKELESLKREIAQLKAQSAGRKPLSKKWAWIGFPLLLVIVTFTANAAIISKPYTFTAGTAISAAEVNADFDVLYAESNSQHTRISTLETNALGKTTIRYLICYDGIYPSRSIGGDGGIGEIVMFAGDFEPAGGWLYCDGRTLQIQQYTPLFSIIGTTYGGNGTTTFALPDLRGKVAVHPTN
jgi:microcystin-dependent protein